MYWDIEGLVCVLGHRGFGVYWDIEGLACVLGHRGFGVYWDIGFVCVLGGIWDSLSYGHAND